MKFVRRDINYYDYVSPVICSITCNGGSCWNVDKVELQIEINYWLIVIDVL